MGKRLRELVEHWAVEPTPANRDAFRRGLVMSMVWSPVRSDPKGTGPSSLAAAGRPLNPMMTGPGGEPLLRVYTDGPSALREPGVKSAGGSSGRIALEQALASGVGLTVTTGHEGTAPRAIVFREDVLGVLALERTEDPILGTIAWRPLSDDDTGFWEFEAGPVGKHPVTGVVVPKVPWRPIRVDEWPRLRQTVQWVRANDVAIRQHIAVEMWDWWSSECWGPSDREAVRSPEQFRDTLRLEAIRFEPDLDAFLVYADQGLVCGYGLRISVSPDGRFISAPMMC